MRVDLEVSQLITALAIGHHTNVIPKIVLLQKFLGEVFHISEQTGGGRYACKWEEEGAT